MGGRIGALVGFYRGSRGFMGVYGGGHRGFDGV